MPALRILASSSSSSTRVLRAPRVYQLCKPITTVGGGEDNDILLADPQAADSSACVQFEDGAYHVSRLSGSADLWVNGKRRRRHRLAHGDLIRMGNTELCFLEHEDAPPTTAPLPSTSTEKTESLLAYRKLFEFSERLLSNYELVPLLTDLMDAVIEITGADKGFLVLMEGQVPRVKVARNVRRETLGNPDDQLSDSVVEKVLRTRRPLIISDALRDQEFMNAHSVLNLRLSSVMCAPLLDRSSLLGVLYVGSSAVRNLFTERTMEVFTILTAQASLLIRNALLVNELRLDNQALTAELERLRFGSLIGACPAMQEVFRKVGKVASTDVSVLITGETGTGKELIAQEIHRRSPRACGPLVTINCGAIPEQLLESELFGHVKGAFTGAVSNKVGRLQAAEGGTVFLDEIGEMPPALQVKLLRVLQERVIVRVGDTRPEPLDIRLLAATHRDLHTEIKAGRFREDLYYRLNVVPLHLPPLRERGDDLLMIAKLLLQRYAKELGGVHRELSPAAAIAIRKYSWPGNIRQLENHIKKALVLSDHATLTPEDLGLREDLFPRILPLNEAKERFQRDYINEVLALNNGNRTKTARDLGVDPRTIFRHLEKEDEASGPQEAE